MQVLGRQPGEGATDHGTAGFAGVRSKALDARKHHIPWQGDGPLPVERMCVDAADTPLDVPLHPAAELYWRQCGYLR